MARRQKLWWFTGGAIVLLILALNFLNLRAASSRTEINQTMSTYRTGDTLPDTMKPGFELFISVTGDEGLAGALATALQKELVERTAAGTTTLVGDLAQSDGNPLLLVVPSTDRLWTPFYGRATVQTQVYYAYDGDAPWPLDEPVVFQDAPAVKADGEFTLEDRTWGLISKAAYTEHLAEALATAIADELQKNVFAIRE